MQKNRDLCGIEVTEMKYQYNDYVEAVKMYLQKYEEFKAYVKTLEDQIAEYEERLAKEGPVAKTQVYSKAPGGGNRQGSVQESYCMRREFMRSEIERMQQEVNETQTVLDRLDLAINRLGDNDRKLMREHWIEGTSWEKTAELIHASTGYCRNRSKKIFVKLAGMMFGPHATPLNLRMIFYKGQQGELCSNPLLLANTVTKLNKI